MIYGELVDNNLELITVMQQPNHVVDFDSFIKSWPGPTSWRVAWSPTGLLEKHDVVR